LRVTDGVTQDLSLLVPVAPLWQEDTVRQLLTSVLL
jgi:hypothetical protein